jgi:uncharacterized membrane protein YfcA
MNGNWNPRDRGREHDTALEHAVRQAKLEEPRDEVVFFVLLSTIGAPAAIAVVLHGGGLDSNAMIGAGLLLVAVHSLFGRAVRSRRRPRIPPARARWRAR